MKKNRIIIIVSAFVLIVAATIVLTLKNNKGVKITKKDNNKVYEKYSNEMFKIDIPKGWKVEVAKGDYNTFMYYTFTAYNPENTDYRIFFNMKTDGYLKTEKMRNWYKNLYPSAIFSKLPSIDPQTIDNFYNNFYDGMTYFFGKSINIPEIKNFEVIEKLGVTPTGGDIVRAIYKNREGKVVDGIFTTTMKEVSLYYVTALSIYNSIFYTAPENELIEWENILNHSISTLEFTDTFISNYYKAENDMMESIKANQKIYDEMSNIITSGWNKRQDTYDIISQKRSDATLGYERVYDTRTGEIYKADLGFSDYDWNGKYEIITDDMYKLPTIGYIEKIK